MRKAVLMVIVKVAKLTGLFAVARRLTARDLRIRCRHGAAVRDEHHFSPGLFMSKETFAARMNLLVRQGYPVIGLEEVVKCLQQCAKVRQDLSRKLFAALGLEASEIEQARICAFMRVDRATESRAGGVDI